MEKPWKVILAFLGVFVAGAVFGGFFSLGIGRRIWEIESPVTSKPVMALPTATASPAAPARTGQSSGSGPFEVQRAQLMRRVANQLNLTAEQKAVVTPIIQRAVQDIWHQQQNVYRESRFITERMKQDIGKELTPDQQTRLDELWKKQIESFRKKQAEAQAQARSDAQLRRANATQSAADEKNAEGGKAADSAAVNPAAEVK